MTYQKQHWSDDPSDNTPLSAARLNHMEDGIANIQTDLEVEDGSITTAKLANLAVTAAKLANNAATTNKIADLAVTSAKIANGAVGSTKIASNAVGSAQLATNAVGNAQLATNAVDSANIQSSAVTAVKIASNAVTNAKIATSAVTPTNVSFPVGRIQYGQYVGDGEWNRVISVGFTPIWVAIVRYSGTASRAKWECFATGGVNTITYRFGVDGVQSTLVTKGTAHANYMIRVPETANNFRINGQGHDPSVNVNGQIYLWWAIGENL